MIYYKATRPDATSFHDGKTKWTVGTTTKIAPSKQRSDLCGDGVLHASDAPAETLVGGSWPCRLFEVEGEPVGQDGHTYGFHQLTVIRELPAWQALGPNGEAVAAHIERCKTITPAQAKQLYAARNAAWNAAWDPARDAAQYAARGAAQYAARNAVRDAAWYAVRDAAWYAAQYAAWYAVRDAAQYAVQDAVGALLVRDLITPEQFDMLYGPWASVMA